MSKSLGNSRRKGPLPLEQALKIGIEISDALDKAHRRGIVHRDLKPGNIMLTGTGAKLMDFGLAKPGALAAAAGSDVQRGLTPSSPTSAVAIVTGGANPLTAAGTVVGTFQYMAPEQIEGQEADTRSDIFALGTVLYEVVTGKRAFEGKSQLSVASAILEKEPAPISSIRAPISPALEHVIARALEKDPEKRWQSAGDISAELEWTSEPGNAAGAVPRAAGVAAPRPGRPWLLAVTALVALTAMVVAGLSLWRKAPAVQFTISVSGRFPMRGLAPRAWLVQIQAYFPRADRR